MSADTDVSHSVHSGDGTDGSNSVSGPIRRRTTVRATAGSRRRSVRHVPVRCVSASRSRARPGAARHVT